MKTLYSLAALSLSLVLGLAPFALIAANAEHALGIEAR